MTLLLDLNEKQREAVTAPPSHMLVLAGAGSGKTRVLVERMAYLVKEKDFSPSSILAVTFTNKAAFEMKTRLEILLDMSVGSLWVGTFHGLCHRILRRHHQEANLTPLFQIMDSDEQGRMIKRAIVSLNLDIEKWSVKQAQFFINQQKDEGIRSNKVSVASFGPGRTLAAIYKRYEELCSQLDVIDFSELLLLTYEILKKNPEVLSLYSQRFRAILVDEFQDTNHIQYALIRLLSEGGAFVMAVGDDDQSIYGWRGAKVDNMSRFSEDFPNTRLVRLEQNYRSTMTILNAANALIEHNTGRLGKDLWTDGSMGEKINVYKAGNEIDEGRFIRETISDFISQGFSLDDIAILYRSNAQSRVLEEALIRAGISYRIHGGLQFFNRAEIRDALAYLRLFVNPHDDNAFERVVNTPARGIGEKTLEKVREFAKENETSLWDAANFLVSQNGFRTLSRFLELIRTLQSYQDLELHELLFSIIQESGLHAHYSTGRDELFRAKLENLEELVNGAKEFCYEGMDEEGMPLVFSFLAHASLSGERVMTREEPAVHLMTLHAAKGLEFPIVFLVGLEEGLFPSPQSLDSEERLEEERRLCYVGITRARFRLFISFAEIRRQYGREEYHRPSRFLKELPSNLLELIQPRASFEKMAPLTEMASQSSSEKMGGPHLSQTVFHAKFGEGVVLALEGAGAHRRVQVRFREHGTKWLVLAYAHLAY